MKVSLNWLKDYIKIKESRETLAELMSLHSQEVEYTQQLVKAKGLVIGYTKSCKPHPDADKLSVCEVDVKTETLTIVCGAPNVAAGQHVIVAKNGAVLPGGFEIKQTTIRGVESNGMICSLDELGIEHKFHNEEGIHVIEGDVTMGDDALKALFLDDEVIALDLTPNRMDLLSMHGVAYDFAAILDRDITIPEVTIAYEKTKNSMTITTETELCESYYGSVIENLEIKPSPLWMKARLIAAGIRPINNVVDITNYVMLETGQPLHAFDYDLLDSEQIVVRTAKKGETFVTLDDKKRLLEEGDILITNGKEPVALGGVMGGAKTEVHGKTTRILLESAVFNPTQIRLTSSRLDLRSESSMRFERRVDVGRTRYALDRATELLIKYANATVRKDVAYFDHTDQSEKIIEIALERINRVLGSDYSTEHVARVLTRLRFDFKEKHGVFYVKKPTRRPDFESYQDLIEEIGRISGYDALPATLPSTVSQGELSPLQRFRRHVRQALTGLGLDEVMTYNLVSKDDVLTYVKEKTLKPIRIKHPMSDKRNVLRLSAINGLLDVVSHNRARQADAVHVFELGKSYQKSGERELLTLAMNGPYQSRKWQETPETSFFTLKGVLEALADFLGVQGLEYEQTSLENYHPHQTAIVTLKGETLGIIGKIHPQNTKRLDLDDVYVLEFDLMKLFEVSQTEFAYETISKLPSVSRDIAIVCDKSIPVKMLMATIKKQNIEIFKSVDVFDVYEGEHVGANQKSLGLRMVFADSTRTLKTEEIDQATNKIIKALEEKHQATLR